MKLILTALGCDIYKNYPDLDITPMDTSKWTDSNTTSEIATEILRQMSAIEHLETFLIASLDLRITEALNLFSLPYGLILWHEDHIEAQVGAAYILHHEYDHRPYSEIIDNPLGTKCLMNNFNTRHSTEWKSNALATSRVTTSDISSSLYFMENVASLTY